MEYQLYHTLIGQGRYDHVIRHTIHMIQAVSEMCIFSV